MAALVLARSARVQALLTRQFGVEQGDVALRLLAAGVFTSQFGIGIHDMFLDEIENNGEVVWRGRINQEFPVEVKDYEGVHFVWAFEHDPVGYFLSAAEAVSYIKCNWNNVRGAAVKRRARRGS